MKEISQEHLAVLIQSLEDYKGKGIIDPWVLNDGTIIEPLDVLKELKLRRSDIPMGVSQWRNHGMKWGYWDFFLKDLGSK